MGTFSRQMVTFGEVGPSFASLLAGLFAPFSPSASFVASHGFLYLLLTTLPRIPRAPQLGLFFFNSLVREFSHFDGIFDRERGKNMNRRVLTCLQRIYL